MKATIENLNLIKITNLKDSQSVKLTGYELTSVKQVGNDYFFNTNKDLKLHQELNVIVDNVSLPLILGDVTITKEFDLKYRYDGKLGFEYFKDKTIFRIFSPVAKDIKLVLGDKTYDMNYIEPIWEVEVKGDVEGLMYHYLVKLENDYQEAEDPYALAASLNGNYVVDLNKTINLKASPIKVDPLSSVIYEGHVRDMTINLDVEEKGLFKGLIEKSSFLGSSVLEHIKGLGITHLQLLPVFDFDSVDDLNKDKLYNWGYNPRRYFSVDGWYSKDPLDPYLRINELKSVVEFAHNIGLGVNMDVVYNHVYEIDNYPYDKFVPKYFYRHLDGKMTDGAFCGNEVESTNYMVRKLIVDSLIHFTENFKIDGFRFDLMGLMDLKTMNLIEEELKKINPNIMLYGEGWNMETTIKSHAANMDNQARLLNYGHFNDSFRDTLKGDLHGTNKGYLMGNNTKIETVMQLLVGSPHLFETPKQSVNYVECHDNLTMYDRLLLTNVKVDKIKDYQDFANHILAISQGITFYHAGQEFYRTKGGVENSYKSSDLVNQIHWQASGDNIDKFKEILKHRKDYQNHYNKPDDVNLYFEKKVLYYETTYQDKKLVHVLINDYKNHKVVKNGEVIFASKAFKTKEKHLVFNKPGVYIFEI